VRDVHRRIDALLLARTTETLSHAEAEELARLLAKHPDVEADVYERAAAAVCLAALDTRAPLPAALRAKLEQHAAAFAASMAPAPR
jgi:hypothetical protein